MCRSLPKDLPHRLALGKIVDHLVKYPDTPYQRVRNLFDAHAAVNTLDQRRIWVQPRSLRKLGLEIHALLQLHFEAGLGAAGEPADDAIDLSLGATLLLRLLNLEGVDG